MELGYYCLDCMEGLKEIPDKYIDLAIVDPPYGISVTGRHGTENGMCKMRGGGSRRSDILREYKAFDDSTVPDERYFEELKRVSKNRIIWGGNFMLDYLGIASCMIVWDKGRRNLDQADCEIAWTSLKGQSRIFDWKWNGMLQQDMKNKEERIHPTQKPVALYEWLLRKFSKPDDIILDTHVGSASSLIACERLGRKYIGFDNDEYYDKVSSERLKRESQQVTIYQLLNN